MSYVGNIYHDSLDNESNPPKAKFYIVVGVTEDGSEFATVFINSNINPAAINSAELQSLQVEIKPEGVFSFLNTVSYIDCGAIPKERLTSTFNRRLNDKFITLKGSISENLLTQIKANLINGGHIYSFYLKKYNITM